MSEVIGSGVIQVSVDGRAVKAGIDDAKRAISSLGDANEKASARSSRSIDNYIKRLDLQNRTLGKSTREIELYKLKLKGASEEQTRAADSALKLAESHRKSAENISALKSGLIAVTALATSAAYAIYSLSDRMIEQITNYQGIAEKIGDTAVNVSSLKLASELSGVALDSVAAASIKLTVALAKTDDEATMAGAAINALGLDFKVFKSQAPVDQLESIANAMAGFKDGAEKTAVAVALFGKAGAAMIPFFNDLSDKGKRHAALTQQQIEALDAYSKSITLLTNSFSMLGEKIVAKAMPALSSLQTVLSDLAKEQAVMSVASDILNGSLSAGITLFQTLAIVGSDVGFVFLGVGREIGAISAQLVALAHGDLTGFNAISQAVKEDSERARQELDRFQQKVMSLGQKGNAQVGSVLPSGEKPKLNIAGLAIPAKKADAGQLGKAILDADLQGIKHHSDALTNVYANAEKIMQANRAAGLLLDSDYYAEKLELLRLNGNAQEQALQAEIARLQAERVVGKEKVDMDTKISEAKFKLAKLQEDTATNVHINSIAEVAAINKTKLAYDEAADSAKNYLEAINRQHARDLSVIGRGEDYAAQVDVINKIEEKRIAAMQRLDRDKRNGLITDQQSYNDYLAIIDNTYAQEITLAENKNITTKGQQSNWLNGAASAFENYRDQAANVAAQTENIFSRGFDGMTDSIASFVTTGKLNFADFAKSMIADITKMMVKMMAMKAIQSMGVGFAHGGAFDHGVQQFAKGGAFDGGAVTKFANGGAFSNSIVDQPTNFNMGLMGEAGAEAIMPLTRMAGGELGVRAIGGGTSSTVQVNVYVQQSGEARVEAPTGLQQFGKELAAFVDARIGKSNRDALRQGGSLYNLRNGLA